jgi:hypothetical protein
LVDEEMFVRIEALENYLEMISFFSEEQIEHDLIQAFSQVVNQVEDEQFFRIVKLSGKLLYTMHQYDLEMKCGHEMSMLFNVRRIT